MLFPLRTSNLTLKRGDNSRGQEAEENIWAQETGRRCTSHNLNFSPKQKGDKCSCSTCGEDKYMRKFCGETWRR
jgi:predicted RNA-binding Zn-ribbon protein involved in translation (DUF1610 family)